MFSSQPTFVGLIRFDGGLESESRGEPTGIPCVVVVRVAVRGHKAEGVGVATIRRTLPPISRGTRGRMTVLDLTIASLIIIILLLVVLLRIIGITASAITIAITKDLALSQKRKVIHCLGHIRSRVAASTRVVGVDIHRLHDSTQIAWKCSHQSPGNRTGCSGGGRIAIVCIGGAKHIVSKIAPFPATRVGVGAMVHVEPLLSASRIIIIIVVDQADVCAAAQGSLKASKSNTVALSAAVVIKAKYVHIISTVDGFCSNSSREGNGITFGGFKTALIGGTDQ